MLLSLTFGCNLNLQDKDYHRTECEYKSCRGCDREDNGMQKRKGEIYDSCMWSLEKDILLFLFLTLAYWVPRVYLRQ